MRTVNGKTRDTPRTAVHLPPPILPLFFDVYHCTRCVSVFTFDHCFFYNLVSKLKRERKREKERERDDECPDTVKKATTARRAVV